MNAERKTLAVGHIRRGPKYSATEIRTEAAKLAHEIDSGVWESEEARAEHRNMVHMLMAFADQQDRRRSHTRLGRRAK